MDLAAGHFSHSRKGAAECETSRVRRKRIDLRGLAYWWEAAAMQACIPYSSFCPHTRCTADARHCQCQRGRWCQWKNVCRRPVKFPFSDPVDELGQTLYDTNGQSCGVQQRTRLYENRGRVVEVRGNARNDSRDLICLLLNWSALVWLARLSLGAFLGFP
jgi:hypothetical protein